MLTIMYYEKQFCTEVVLPSCLQGQWFTGTSLSTEALTCLLLSPLHPVAADLFSHFSPAHSLSINHCANSCDASCEVLWELWQRFLGRIRDLVVNGWLQVDMMKKRLSSSAEQPLRKIHCDSSYPFSIARLSSVSAWIRKGVDICLPCGSCA